MLMKQRFWMIVAIAFGISIVVIWQPAIAQRSGLTVTTPLTVQVVAAQESASVGNAQPAKLLAIVTDSSTGRPVIGLTPSNITITNHSSPTGAICGFSGEIRSFGDVGTGAYQIQLGLRTSIPGYMG